MRSIFGFLESESAEMSSDGMYSALRFLEIVVQIIGGFEDGS